MSITTRRIAISVALWVLSLNAYAFQKCPTASGVPDTFALCALAQCWTLDGVSYCKCEIKNEESISIPFNYTEGSTMKNVCDLLTQGVANGFTISTYATPTQALQSYSPTVEQGPAKALYTCDQPGYSVRPAYSAQCDGGVCFASTTGTNFPGLGAIGPNEIVCSCPPTANTQTFQIAGPWNCAPGESNDGNRCCDRGYYESMCGVRSIAQTGTVMAVGSPSGSAVILSTELDGYPPQINTCDFSNSQQFLRPLLH